MAHDDTKFDSIFCGAIEIASAEERAAFIARACGPDEGSCVTSHRTAGRRSLSGRELLTGTTPLERKRVPQLTILELLRLVREEEAPRPSTRLRTTDELPSIAANRGTEPKRSGADSDARAKPNDE